MGKLLYTAEAHVTGGREHGHATAPDGQIDLQLRPPQQLGGDGSGTNPEQLFAAGYAACFEGALGAVARRRRAELGDVAIDSHVDFIANDDRTFGLAVQLDVTLPDVADDAEAADIVRAAHGVCPYSNATRGNIEVRLTANGQEVAAAEG